MNVRSDAILINQCDHFAYEEIRRDGCSIRAYSLKERGGTEPEQQLLRADQDICLFADEDIIYDETYPEKVSESLPAIPEADMLLFNAWRYARQDLTYHTDAYGRVGR